MRLNKNMFQEPYPVIDNRAPFGEDEKIVNARTYSPYPDYQKVLDYL